MRINIVVGGEILLTVLSSLAQEESRSISENCTWDQRKRFQDGKVSVPFKRFLGYDRGENGELVVNEEQAKTVRRILIAEATSPAPGSRIQTLTGETLSERQSFRASAFIP